MAVRSLSEAVTDSFYAWETRGRGWMLADYPVALEPPFRPFFLLPEHQERYVTPIDDGRRPTIASRLLDSARQLFAAPHVAAPVPLFEEQEPFPALPPSELSVFRLSVPATYESSAAVMAQLLSALSAAVYPVSFELIGAGGEVTIQIVASSFDVDDVAAHIEGFVPEVAVTEGDDRLRDVWREHAAQSVIDIGLTHEFFLPIQTARDFHIDPYVPLMAALARAAHGEFVLLQVLFERTRNPWVAAVNDALDDGDGGCLIADAEWFVPAAKKKTESPLYATVLRVGAQAATHDRALDLIRGTHAFFLQYANPSGNGFAPLVNEGYDDNEHVNCLRSRTSHRTGMLLSANELVGLVHVPDRSVRHGALRRTTGNTRALPALARGHPLILGENVHRGESTPASLDFESRFAHTWIVGGSGTGKSTLVASLVLQDIEAGHCVAVLDPHGDLIDDVVARIPTERANDVILFDPSDVEYAVGFNILRATSTLEHDLLASDLVAIFRRLSTSWGDTMTTVRGQAVLALLSHPTGGTLVELRRFLVDDGFRKAMLSSITDTEIHFFWEKEYPIIGARSIGPLLSRLDGFLRTPLMRNIVGQREAKLDLGAAMTGRTIFLARLSKGQIGDENAYLLGSLFLAKFNQLALMRQAEARDARRPFFCYADEFQHFVSPSMESLLTEGRKYRFGLVLAHQALAQLDGASRIEGALFANCHTRIVFRVSEDDATKLGKGFAGFEATDLLAQVRGEALARMGGSDSAFNLKTHALPAVLAADGDERRTAVIRLTRERYGVARDSLTAPREVGPAPSAPPEVIGAVPEMTSAPVSQPLPDVVTPTPAPPAGTARKKERMEATPPQTGRGGQMHKYLQHLVKRLAEERGFRASIEAPAAEGQVDVRLERDGLIVGCEISVTTDAAHELENLRKCLSAGFARIIFISPERKQRDAVAKLTQTEMRGAHVDVIGPEDIVTTLDALGAAPMPTESVVRGYKVKVTRQALTPGEATAKRSAIAAVVVKGMREKW